MESLPDAPPHRPTILRRLGTLARWPVGIALTSWRYMWRTTALHRSEETGDRTDLPPGIPDDLVDDETQGVGHGEGPLLHRRFTVLIAGSSMSPAELMEDVRGNINRAVPSEVAYFRKVRGEEGPFRRADEYIVRMPGPWDGPVRVVHEDEVSFRLATLRGHLEAGQIEFSCACEGDRLRFRIEAWARAGDRLSNLLYSRLGVSKEIQLNMWVHVCLRVAAMSGGRPAGGVTISTRTLTDLPAA
ncbi:MAG: DUF1990 family protein [Nocardioidaceae bacterium]